MKENGITSPRGEYQALAALHTDMARCVACQELAETRTQVVPGDGPEQARLLFLGEAPGFHEDQQGHPFVGPAGQFLNDLLGLAGLRRKDVFVTNVIKCRPPGNRDPLPHEVKNCSAWLRLQMALIRPRVIVTLGRYSMAGFFPGESISKIHGRARTKDGIIYVAMYHPAAALHQGSLRPAIEEDFRRLPALLKEAEAQAEDKKEGPKQLSMFGE